MASKAKKSAPYEVPKLKDFSAKTLDASTKKLLAALEAESKAVGTEAEWKTFRDRWMARTNGILTQINDHWLKAAPKETKRDAGKIVNELKLKVTEVVDARRIEEVKVGQVVSRLDEVISLPGQSPSLDITLPGTRRPLGSEHLVIKTMNEIVSVFRNLGYSVEEGPEIETDYYNFEALNFPPNHPARDTQDTLFVANQESKPPRDRLLLRTHTSPVQIRAMQKRKPPLRVVCPGKVHRNDAPDATHSPIFHQVEGLAVDTNITFSRSEGHARLRHEGAVRLEREDSFLSVIFSLHRAQRRRANQLHFLLRHRISRRRPLPQLQIQRLD